MDITMLDRNNKRDLEAVSRLYQEVFAEAPWYETSRTTKQAEEYITASPCTWWIALDQDEIIGFVAGMVNDPDSLSTTFDIPRELLGNDLVAYKAELGVAPSCRGQGIAQALTGTLMQQFKREDTNEFVVRTRPGTGNYAWYSRRALTRCYTYADGRVLFYSRSLPTL